MSLKSATLVALIGTAICFVLEILDLARPLYYGQRNLPYLIRVILFYLPLIIFFWTLHSKQKQKIGE